MKKNLTGLIAAVILLVGLKSVADVTVKEEKQIYYVETIEITGNGIKQPLSLTLKDLEAMKSITLTKVIKYANYRGYLGIYDYIGVPLKDILEKAGLNGMPQKLVIVVSSPDGYYATFSWGELFNSALGERIIIAYKSRQTRVENDEWQYLQPEWGGAFRLIDPDSIVTDERSVKWVEKITVFYALD